MDPSSSESREFVVGTSGHIDHGKTALVKALTGVDADRFEEEKQRGITIDLGFAPYEDESGTRLGFVDVPGHEKFVHNMLAGVAGFDAVLLVIAADEGVMPQTREHLNICNLLQIPNGLVALTRIDLVEDAEMIELCRDEIEELVEGTFLEGKPIIPVSSLTGKGIPELKNALQNLRTQLAPPQLDQPFRMFVDRSFSVKGFGTVVTGTVLSGSVKAEEELQHYPGSEKIRIRGIQVHGKNRNEVHAGNRAALNLAGISQLSVQRGEQLAGRDSLINSFMLNVELSLLEDAPADIRQRSRVRFHLGSQEVMGRVILLENDHLPRGTTALAQLRLEEEVSSRYGDRFILRSYSPLMTLGGGRIIDPAPGKSRRIKRELAQRLKRLASDDQEGRVEEVIFLQSVRGVLEREVSLLAGLSGRQSAKILQALQSRQQILCVDPTEKRYLHAAHLERIGNFLQKVLRHHHQRFPEREGMNRVELGGKLSLLFQDREMELLLKYLVKNGMFVSRGAFYALEEHEGGISEQTESLMKRCTELILEGGFQPLRRTLLLEQLELSEKEGIALLKACAHQNRLVQVSEDLYYTPEQIDQAVALLRKHFKNQPVVTVIDFKELLDISRKHAVELLEYFDSQHLTIRQENQRVPARIMEA